MRIVLVSKALVVGAYLPTAEASVRLGQVQGVALLALIPLVRQEHRGCQIAQARHTQGHHFQTISLRLNGNSHLPYAPTLAKELAAMRPSVVHGAEEPYIWATQTLPVSQHLYGLRQVSTP